MCSNKYKPAWIWSNLITNRIMVDNNMYTYPFKLAIIFISASPCLYTVCSRYEVTSLFSKLEMLQI